MDIVSAFQKMSTRSDQAHNLSVEGKDKAIAQALATKNAAVSEFNEQQLKNIDANRLELRAALLSDTTIPDSKHVELMASHLLKLKRQDIGAFYDKASESERRTMEAASAFIGRVPTLENGHEWKTLLDPEIVNEAIMARAEATNPAAVQKLRELDEIRAMQVSTTNVALSEI